MTRKNPPACKHPAYRRRESTGAMYCTTCGSIRSKCIDDTGTSWVADPVPVYRRRIEVEHAPDETAKQGTNGHGDHEPEAA